MITMNVYAKENTAPVIVEAEAVAGLQKLARIFCGDIEKVTGHQPECIEGWQENASDHILVATCDRSKILAELEAQKKSGFEPNSRQKRSVWDFLPRKCAGTREKCTCDRGK